MFPFAPCWCVVGDELVLSLFPQNIKAFLNRSDDFESLADLEQLDEWFEAHDGPMAFSYTDERELLRRIYPWVQIYGQLIMSEVRLDLEKIEFDMSMLPSLPSIERHLDVAISATYRTPEAIESKSRQTLPGNGLIAMAPLWYWMVAFRVDRGVGPPIMIEGPDDFPEPEIDPFDGEDPLDDIERPDDLDSIEEDQSFEFEATLPPLDEAVPSTPTQPAPR